MIIKSVTCYNNISCTPSFDATFKKPTWHHNREHFITTSCPHEWCLSWGNLALNDSNSEAIYVDVLAKLDATWGGIDLLYHIGQILESCGTIGRPMLM